MPYSNVRNLQYYFVFVHPQYIDFCYRVTLFVEIAKLFGYHPKSSNELVHNRAKTMLHWTVYLSLILVSVQVFFSLKEDGTVGRFLYSMFKLPRII